MKLLVAFVSTIAVIAVLLAAVLVLVGMAL